MSDIKKEDDLDQEFEEFLKKLEEQEEKLDLNGHLDELNEMEKDEEDIDYMVYKFCDKARILYKNYKYDDAITLLKEGLKKYPTRAELYCYMGFTCLARAQKEGETSPSYYEALTFFQKAIGLDQRCARAHYGLGLVELKGFANSYSAQSKYKLLMTIDPRLAFALKDEISKFLMKHRY